MTDTTLLIGGTGKTGRRVAERLTARGADVRIGSRRGDPPFDGDDPSGWGPALDGVRAAYVTFYPDLALPGAAGKVGALARLAAARGVRQLVLLSGRGEVEQYREMLRTRGLPVELADVFTSVLDGRNATPADGVRQALGRPAKDFAAYAGETAATGIWKA
jgi:nucleoside-diphosphate-sugar epimerase